MKQQSGLGGAVLSFDVHGGDPATLRAQCVHGDRQLGGHEHRHQPRRHQNHHQPLRHDLARAADGGAAAGRRHRPGPDPRGGRPGTRRRHQGRPAARPGANCESHEPVSPRRRRASSISATSARRCTRGRSRARRAAPSSCASRTPTSSARRRRPWTSILEGMEWLGLDHDEGPFYQMQRMDRYSEVLAQMQDKGLVYPCYMSVAELDALRERQMANKEKPRYDGTWRPEPGKTLPAGARGRAAGAALPQSARRRGGVGRQGQGPHRDQQRRTRRPGDRAARRHADVQLLRGGRRHRHADHARDPRRRPREQHAAPDQHLPRARQGAAGVSRTCRPC